MGRAVGETHRPEAAYKLMPCGFLCALSTLQKLSRSPARVVGTLCCSSLCSKRRGYGDKHNSGQCNRKYKQIAPKPTQPMKQHAGCQRADSRQGGNRGVVDTLNARRGGFVMA